MNDVAIISLAAPRASGHFIALKAIISMPSADRSAVDSSLGDAMDHDDDAALYDARKAEMAASGETPLPGAVGAALPKGDSLLKAIRHWRGLSQTVVAQRAAVGQRYLSDMESRRRPGTTETFERLAGVLDVPVRWLAAPKLPWWLFPARDTRRHSCWFETTRLHLPFTPLPCHYIPVCTDRIRT